MSKCQDCAGDIAWGNAILHPADTQHVHPATGSNPQSRGGYTCKTDNQTQKTQLVISFMPRVTMRASFPVTFPLMPVLPE